MQSVGHKLEKTCDDKVQNLDNVGCELVDTSAEVTAEADELVVAVV